MHFLSADQLEANCLVLTSSYTFVSLIAFPNLTTVTSLFIVLVMIVGRVSCVTKLWL